VEEGEDVVEEDDENVLEHFVGAQTDLEHDLPLVHTTSVASRMLNKLNRTGKISWTMI
jgi:hypothetical protein